ncbi:lysozyme inhibitor LprI family protein [Pseudomonas sp.]|uniref:lysozyme inhibitor LprI family protein n=1 Tax=Pseudomonas sp. TaxID=306 RepID=UPI003A96AFA3
MASNAMGWILVMGVSGALAPVQAADDPEDPCQQGSAMAAFMCQGPVWKAAEQELQRTYDRLMASLKQDDPALAEDLRNAQRLWIKLREQDCSLYARSRVQGSPWTGFWESECHAEQARARSAWLKSFEG